MDDYCMTREQAEKCSSFKIVITVITLWVEQLQLLAEKIKAEAM